LGTDAGKPSEEIACAEAMAALSKRPGTAAVETANNLTRSCLFIIPPSDLSALPASVVMAPFGESAEGNLYAWLVPQTFIFLCKFSRTVIVGRPGHALNAPTIGEAGRF
jgi:hypothetical protein